jgi:uridine phosphorylase
MALIKHAFPILESDLSENGVIHPSDHIAKNTPTPLCLIAFFQDVIDAWNNAGKLRLLTSLKSEAGRHPVWLLEHNEKTVGLFHPMLGGAFAAGLLEELIALGFTTFVSCGGAGVLQKEIGVGSLIVPNAALRQEGVSYQYMEPSRTVAPDEALAMSLSETLGSKSIPFRMGWTWTTDAFYRETKDMVDYRKSEGCLCVEMECASFFAVAKYRNVRFASLLYGGDDVSGSVWDGRGWHSRFDVRQGIMELALETLTREVKP